jgi:2-oxoglutarate ferredoxin oxidoreductase subunit alpha
LKEISILIGGKAGDGIKEAGQIIARLLNRLGYRIFLYDEYPSLVKGGHNFNVIRGSDKKIRAHKKELDIIVALNQETAEKHNSDLKSGGVVLYDSDEVDIEGIGIPFTSIVKEMEGIPIMRNTAAIGALAKSLDIEWPVVDKLIADTMEKQADLNLKIAQKAYDKVDKFHVSLTRLEKDPQPLLTGNQAIALGAVQGGLNMYIAYPMTPSSGILHFLAGHEDDLGIVTIQPENEIAVALMALGGAYAGARTMVGTSGGGFALMTEAVSLAGEAEIPVVFVESQRAGASTGVPTYTAQGDLLFVLHAGHGEFLKLVLAPGDVEEAFQLTALAMKLAWKYQTPAFILSDKHLSESTFSFDSGTGAEASVKPLLWDGKGEYRRYEDKDDGISPLAFPGNPNAVVKVSSNEHNYTGFSTKDPEMVERILRKRLRKRKALIEELSEHEQVKVYGNNDSKIVAICWGSTKGSCVEAAEELDIKMVQPLVIEPFPIASLNKALSGAEKIINVEINATGQLGKILSYHGINIDHNILRFDARPFTVESLVRRIKEVLS